MKDYAPYLSALRQLLHRKETGGDFGHKVEAALNGEASSELNALVARTRLKKAGAFFSSPDLSKSVAQGFKPKARQCLVAADPACGAGNLLIAAAGRLPVKRELSATLRNWGDQLAGFDRHTEFVDATHLRLALLARQKGARYDLTSATQLADFFPNIQAKDGIRGLKTLIKVDHFLLNPPFNQVKAPSECSWGQGKVSKAALFISSCLDQAQEGTKLSAILPDVLRAGSRYKKWRAEIARDAWITRIAPMGNFQTADVDVFVLDFTVGIKNRGLAPGVKWWSPPGAKAKLGDQFFVRVGPVVKHRVKKHHRKRPYLHAKGLPFWGNLSTIADTVRFNGPLIKPPFVVIRRTSSPTDRHRALATLISSRQSVAVDNHLIVCKPLRGGVGKCHALIKALKTEGTNQRLNRRIRCRHLTVGVVREIQIAD